MGGILRKMAIFKEGNALRIKQQTWTSYFRFENISFVDFEIGHESVGGDLEDK